MKKQRRRAFSRRNMPKIGAMFIKWNISWTSHRCRHHHPPLMFRIHVSRSSVCNHSFTHISNRKKIDLKNIKDLCMCLWACVRVCFRFLFHSVLRCYDWSNKKVRYFIDDMLTIRSGEIVHQFTFKMGSRQSHNNF